MSGRRSNINMDAEEFIGCCLAKMFDRVMAEEEVLAKTRNEREKKTGFLKDGDWTCIDGNSNFI